VSIAPKSELDVTYLIIREYKNSKLISISDFLV